MYKIVILSAVLAMAFAAPYHSPVLGVANHYIPSPVVISPYAVPHHAAMAHASAAAGVNVVGGGHMMPAVAFK